MRFYDATGKCYICNTSWSSETEVKKHLLYVHLIIIDDNDPDAIHFVKNRVSKKIYVGTGKNKKPMLEYINCGNGPFYNNFGIVQHKIEDCEANAEDSKKLNKDIKNMSFNIEYIQKVYSNLKRPYYIEVGNLNRIYKGKEIIKYKRKLSNEPKNEYSTECIICTMTWPSEERCYFKSTEEFVKHNIDHILENCMEKIKPQPKKQQK